MGFGLAAAIDPAYTSIVPHSFWQVLVSNYGVQPGARVLWCLRRRTTDVRCILSGHILPVEVVIMHDRDVILTELFQEEWMAIDWARIYGERLRAQGWFDTPHEGAKAAG